MKKKSKHRFFGNGRMKRLAAVLLAGIILAFSAGAEKVQADPAMVGVYIQEGVYEIVSSVNPNFCLDISQGSFEERANLQLWNRNGSNAQRFLVTRVGNGNLYAIQNLNSGKVIDAQMGGKTSGTNLWQWRTNGSAAQLFRFVSVGNGTFEIQNAGSGLCIDTNQGLAKTANNVQLWKVNHTPAQRWYLYSRGTVAAGRQTIQQNIAAQNSKPAGNNAGSSTGKTAAPTEQNRTQAKIKDGLYEFVSAVNQDYCLDISGGSISDKANLQIWKRNGSNAQKFFLWNRNGYYYIRNCNSDLWLDVENSGKKKGTNVYQRKASVASSQQFRIYDAGNGTYEIQSVSSGLYLDVSAGIAKNGQNVQIWDGNHSPAQRWILKDTSQNGHSDIFKSNLEKSSAATSKRDRIFAKTKPGQKTLKNFLQNALIPCGRVLYIWGGGHGNDTRRIGYYPTWGSFFKQNATPNYNRGNFEWWYGSGVDCSGYVSWVAYNTVHTTNYQNLAPTLAQQQATYYSNLGLTQLRGKPTSYSQLKAGDVCSMDGHVYICLGTCSDGSAVILHSSPMGKKHGGGIQLSGTSNRSGNMHSEGYALAKQYMEKYFAEWPYGVETANETYMSSLLNIAGWKNDPDGMRNMGARQVLKILFEE